MAQKSTLDKKILQKIKAYRSLIEKTGTKVQEIYVFGSQAKGRAKSWSDIDVGIISPSFGNDRQEERVSLMILSNKIDPAIEPHPFSPKDFNDRFYPLAQEIKRYGIKIDKA